MPKSIRILIVEDSENDTHLLLRQIRKGGYEPVWERVYSEEDLHLQLAAHSWDLVLTDYNIPGFSGIAALKVVHAFDPDMPFILVSGAIGEEIAVEAMRLGAHDFLLKDNLLRLVPAIEREIKEARNRRKQHQAEEARLQLSIDLKHAKEVAEFANQRKSRVLAFVAHELKNPLIAAQTFAEILGKEHAKGKLSDAQQEYVDGIVTACQHIRELINDILDIAPIEAGQIELKIQTVDLRALLDEVQIIVRENAKKRELQIAYDIPEHLSLIRVDSKRIRQIFINLLSNAIKYTHAGDTICLSAEVKVDKLEIRVEDHGPGIPEEELKNLFLDYYRVRNSLSKQNEGLGLGLALVKTLTELHDGDVTVQSTLGQGTTFIVSLPYSVIVPCTLLPGIIQAKPYSRSQEIQSFSTFIH